MLQDSLVSPVSQDRQVSTRADPHLAPDSSPITGVDDVSNQPNCGRESLKPLHTILSVAVLIPVSRGRQIYVEP